MISVTPLQAVDENVAYAIVSFSSSSYSTETYRELIMMIETDSALLTTDQIPFNSYKDNISKTFVFNEIQQKEINNLKGHNVGLFLYF